MTTDGANSQPQTNPGKRLQQCLLAAGGLVMLAVVFYALDLTINRALSTDILPGDLYKCIELSEFFAHAFGVGMILISIAILFPDVRRRVPRVLACALFSGVLATAAKSLVGRMRPGQYEGEFPASIAETWQGWLPILNMPEKFDYPIQAFPSGHTATAVGLAMGLCWLYPRGKWLFFTMAILGGFQRIATQAHWPSDVFFGAAMAVAISSAILFTKPAERIFGKFERGGTQKSDVKDRALG